MSVPSGYCRWTLQNGVWSVESNCASGQRCVQMVSGTTTAAADGTVVTVNRSDNHTFTPANFGVPDAAFRAMLAVRHKAGQAISVATAHAVAPFGGTLAAAATSVDIPCQPDTKGPNATIALARTS